MVYIPFNKTFEDSLNKTKCLVLYNVSLSMGFLILVDLRRYYCCALLICHCLLISCGLLISCCLRCSCIM